MTTVHIAPPAIPQEVTAEQVAAYLLRPGSGWVEQPPNPWRRFVRQPWPLVVSVPREGLFDARAQMEITIIDIARAEGLHPSGVLAAIVGPAVGVASGVECERRRGWNDRFMCGNRLCIDFREEDERSDG